MTSSPGSSVARHDQVDGFTGAHRNQNFGLRIVLETVQTPQVSRDLAAEFQRSHVGRVIGVTALYGIDGCFANVPGCDKVRFANAERNNAVCRDNQVEEAS